MELASNEYDAAWFSDELKFVFLCNAALELDDTRNIVIQRALRIFEGVQDALLEYHHSCTMF